MYSIESLAKRFPSVLEAIEREWTEGTKDTVEGILKIRSIRRDRGAILYSVRSQGGDFYVIEDPTGTGCYYQEKEDALHDWNL